MPVPKRKTTRSKRAMRRAHHDIVGAPELATVQFRNQVVVVPSKVGGRLDRLKPKQLKRLGIDLDSNA